VHSESSKKRKMTRRDKSFQSTDKIVECPSQPLDREVSPVAEPTPMETSSSKVRSLKGKKLVFSPPVVVEAIKPRRPFTRSATKQLIPMEEDTSKASAQQKDKTQPSKQPIEIIEINSPSHESNPTFKRPRRQLKDRRAENEKLKEENLEARIKLKNTLDLYEGTIDKARYMAKRSLPLHRQLTNVYRQKRACQAEIRRLKAELQPFKEKIAKINLDMLARVATRRSTRKR